MDPRSGWRRRRGVGWLAIVIVLGMATAQDAPTVAATPSHVLDVLTFNTALLPGIAARTEQAARAAAMAPHLVGYDVLVLQELFDDRLARPLLRELEAAYPYRGDPVGRSGARGVPWRQAGGILILSRWPIERHAEMTFDGVCSGTDCLADKGVAYAAVRKGDRVVHVFATHAQSEYGMNVVRVRAAQFVLLRGFVDAQRIPAGEPVILAGDLNVDAHAPELADMLALLRAVRPPTVGEHVYTWDPRENRWAGGRREWLDYVLFAGDHAAPVEAWNRALPLRDGDLDLSDHFAVWGRLVFSVP